MLPHDLETWLSSAGDRVLHMPEPWSDHDQLIHELWLFDTEARNGGVSQYFGNWPERWALLSELTTKSLPSFAPVASAIDEVIAGGGDPYDAVLVADERLESVWHEHQGVIVAALREAAAHSSSTVEPGPELEKRQSDHPTIRYHDTTEPVRLGDRVEVRYRLFFRDVGRVIYVPGVSPKRPALERASLAWIAVRFDRGGGIDTLVMPDGALKKTVKLIARDEW